MPEINVKGKYMLQPKDEKLLINGNVYITEKMDGANSGIHKKNGKTHLQKKGSNIDGSHLQYKYFELWGYENFEKIKSLPDNMVYYGELMFCTHTIFYDKLPDWFLIFAIYDLKKNKFLKWEKVTEIANQYGFYTVPFLYEGKTDKNHLMSLIKKESLYGDTSEGIVIQNIRQQIRGKIVKPEFFKKIDDEECHWSHIHIKFNKLVGNQPFKYNIG